MFRFAQQFFAKAYDQGERIVKILSDAAGHCAKRCQALLLNQLLLRRFELEKRFL